MNFYDLIFKGEVGHSTRMGWWENILGEFIGGVAKLIAKFLKIKGNTLVWNQLVENGNFVDVSVWQTYNCSYTVSNNVATVTRTNGGYFIYGSVTPIASHKYLFSCDVKPVTTKAIFYWDAGHINKEFTVVGNQWNHLDTMFAVTTVHGINISVRVPDSADDYQLKNFMLIDLTAMFGSTKADEIYAMEQSESGSGVAYFRSLYPLPYYQYNVGSLLSFNGEGIKTVGFNQWDEEWEVGALSGSTGLPISSTNQIRSKNYNPCISGFEYYFHSSKTDGGYQNIYYFAVFFYDSDKNYISRVYTNRHKFTVPTNASYFKFISNSSGVVYGDEYLKDICINISSDRNGEYEPYQASTTSIPTLTYFPTGMKSAGTVYDELTNKKAITRIGEVDLGTLDWEINTSYAINRFNAIVTGMDASTTLQTKWLNVRCPLYITDNSPIASQNIDKTIAKYNGKVYILDSAYNDADSFKQAMNGVTLYYELATPTEVDINPPLNLSYQVWEGGTEQLLPVNTDTPVTTPISADIKYPDGERDDQYFTYRQYLPNNQLLGMALNTLMGKNVPFNQEALDILMKGE